MAASCPHLIAATDFSRTDQSAASPKPSISHEISRDKIHAQMLKTGESLEQEISENSSPEKVVSAAKKLLQKSPNAVPKSPEAKEKKLSGEGLLDSNIWTLPNDPAQMREVHRIGLEKDQAWQFQVSLPGHFFQVAGWGESAQTPEIYIPFHPSVAEQTLRLQKATAQLEAMRAELQKNESSVITTDDERLKEFREAQQRLMWGSGPEIPVTFSFPVLKKGKLLEVELLDGGQWADTSRGGSRQLAVDENGLVAARVKLDVAGGRYRVVVRAAGQEATLRLWYGVPPMMAISPEKEPLLPRISPELTKHLLESAAR